MFGARAIKRRRDKEAELKAQKANGPPPAFVRAGPSGVKGGKSKQGKGKNGKKGSGKKEGYDLIVHIDLQEWKLSDDMVAELKEVFMLFDRDEDGVLSIQELQVVMKSLGQRPTEEELLTAVREVSEDYIYDTLEFNEFLQMMAKQQNNVHTREDVKGAFRIFDDDDDGCIHAQDLVEVLTSMGEKLSKSEARRLVQKAAKNEEGMIDYEAFVESLAGWEAEKEKEKEDEKKAEEKAEEEKKKEEEEVKLAW